MQPTVTILDSAGQPARASMLAGAGIDGFANQMRDFQPALQAPSARLPELRLGNARSDHLVNHNAMASGAVQLHVDNVVGSLFRLSYKPMYKRLGMDEEAARSFAKDVEDAWRETAEDADGCFLDAERRRTFTMMCREVVGTHTTYAEAMAAAQWIDRRDSVFKTAIKMISPKRLSNPNREPDNGRLRGGVELDAHGAAVAYHVQGYSQSGARYGFDAGQGFAEEWQRIPVHTRHGRRSFLHAFEPSEDGQVRGRNMFMTVMEQMHMLPKLQHTKLQNAIVNAMYAAVIESNMDSEEVFALLGSDDGAAQKKITDLMGMQSAFHDGSSIKMDGVKAAHLFPGERLNFQTAGNADGGYTDLSESILRWTARGLNVPYESLAQDFSRSSYSAARASMLEGFRYFMGRRKIIVGKFASQVFSLWLEEALHRGIVKPPKALRGFYEAKAAWCNSDWIGQGRLSIDGLKEVKEAVLRIESGLSTYEKEAALMGEDYQEMFAQQVRETKERADAGLPAASWVKIQGLSADGAEQSESEKVSGRTSNDR